jgi:hypothetical protein
MNNIINVKNRRLLIRTVVVFIWIVLGVFLFIFNRGHTILVDNRNLETHRAPDLIKVTVDKGKPLEFFRGDRDLFEVGGGKHRILIEFSDGNPPFEANFKLPLGPDMFLLSIPKIINGIDPYIEVFRTQQESRNVDEDDTVDNDDSIIEI